MSERTFSTTYEVPKAKLAYNVQLEINEFQKLSQLEGRIPPEQFAQELLKWRQEKLINQQTNLGERFNAQLFEVSYPITNNRLQNPFRNEPMLDSIVNGQQERFSARQLSRDDKRELVEVTTFSAVESYFQKNEGALIVPSPAGGSFGLNFVDVYHSQNINSEKSVVMSRFPTNLSLQEHWQLAQKLTSFPLGEISPAEKDIQIKSLVIQTPLTINEIRKIYRPEENTTSLFQYNKLLTATNGLINNYVDSIIRGEPMHVVQRNHNSVLKFADIYMGRDTDLTHKITPSHTFNPENIARVAAMLGSQEIRTVKTGCGLQGSAARSQDLIFRSLFEVPGENLFSVGEDEHGTLTIKCESEGCGATYQRTPGKLEKNCRKCGGTKGITC